MDELIVFGWIAAAIIAYAALKAVFAKLAHPLRIEMANLGGELMEKSDINDGDRKVITRMLDRAFDWDVIIETCLIFPLFLLRSFKKRDGETVDDRCNDCSMPPWVRPGVSPETAEMSKKFIDLHIISALAANPVFSVVLVIELVIALIVALVVTRSFKAVIRTVKFAIAKSDEVATTAMRLAH